MYAIEFESVPKDGYIQIPEKYKEVFDSQIKIILIKEDQGTGMKDKKDIKELIEKILRIDVFKRIEDPVEWQREIRNEWEKSSFR
jgi:hypothetical protein